MSRVKVIAISDGFIDGVLRKAGETFQVKQGAELGSVWFRPVVVDSIPQGEVEDVVKPQKRGGKRKQQDAQPPAGDPSPPATGDDDIG